MRTSDAADLVAGARATVGAVFGSVGDLLGADGDTFDAVLSIDDDASVPLASLLRPGTTHAAVVHVGPGRDGVAPRKLCIKIPDAYGRGRDQDFLLASSGDGAPLHHAVVPSDPVAPLYSSLWLYLAGLQPALFGARPTTTGRSVRFAPGDGLSFMTSPRWGGSAGSARCPSPLPTRGPSGSRGATAAAA